MKKYFGLLFVLSISLYLGGCAGMGVSDFESPVVSLQTFKVLPQNGVSPRFEIGLHVINPNRQPLTLKGIYYTVEIEGYEVLAGVSNSLPTVEPYGEADIIIEAAVDFIKGIKLINSLMQEPRDSFQYSFQAKLDPGGFARRIIVQEDGEFSLKQGKY